MIIASLIITFVLFTMNVETETFINYSNGNHAEGCRSGSSNNYYDYIIVG